jgi:DNA/RNA endonuclease YhcR with UshA esterase domain
MKPLFAWLCAFVALTVTLLTPCSQAQAAESTAGRFHYDVSREVTIKGTVLSLIKEPSAEMVPGSHLMVATAAGNVDVSLGRFALQGRGALAVHGGEYLEVTGVTMTLKGAPVFIARTVKVGEQVFLIRNEHGIGVSPQARQRASEGTTANRGAL